MNKLSVYFTKLCTFFINQNIYAANWLLLFVNFFLLIRRFSPIFAYQMKFKIC